VKFGVGVLGFFVGTLPINAIREYRVFLGKGDIELLSGLSIITGGIGIMIALRLLKARYR
jgi:hypothetical protein